jgi:hypothetical protein
VHKLDWIELSGFQNDNLLERLSAYQRFFPMLSLKKVLSTLLHLLEHHFGCVLASTEDLNTKTMHQAPFLMFVSTVQHDDYSDT